MNTEIDNEGAELEVPAKPKLDLTVSVRETSACERHVTVSIPRTDIDRYFNEKFDELVPQAEVPGFRAGKAPRRLVESRFKPQIEDQVKGSLLIDSLAQISDQETFSAISEPDFDFETIKVPDDGPMTFEFNIEVRPEFEMPEWKGLTLTRTEREVSDEDVDIEIAKLVSRSRDLVPIDEPAREGDFIVANIASRHDGKDIEFDSEVLIEVRNSLVMADATIDGFGKLVIGACAGESRTAKVKISEYSTNEKLQGQEVDVEFEILDVKRPESPDIEEICETLGFADPQKLREIVRLNIENQTKYAQRQEVRKQINELLTESAKWDLPQDLLRRQSRREMERAMMELRSSGFSESDILNQENILRQNVLKRTEAMLKEHFILERIAETEKVEESDEDFNLEIAKIALQKNDSPRRVRARLERTGQMDALRNMIIEQKVISMIESSATFKTVKGKKKGKESVAAIEFFVAGNVGEAIPEARYDDAPEQPKLPSAPVERE